MGYVRLLNARTKLIFTKLINFSLVCYACDTERNCPTSMGKHGHFQCQNTFLFFTLIIVVVLAIICIIAIFLLWRRLKYGKFGEPSFSHARPCDDQSYGYEFFLSSVLSCSPLLHSYQQVDDQHSPDLNTYTPSSPVQFGSNTSFNYPIEERFLFNRGSLQSSFKDSAPIVSPKNSDWRVENDSYGSLGTSINS